VVQNTWNKTHFGLNMLHWRSHKFWLGGAQNGKILWRFFSDDFRWRNGHDITKKTS